jgi:ATP-binding cassette subfamily B protein
MQSLRRALVYLRPYWLIVLGALLSLILVSAANLLSPQILRLVIDQGISAGNTQALIWSTAALLGVAVVRGLFSFTQGYLSEKSSQSAAYEMRNALFAKIENLSFSYHDQAQTGQLIVPRSTSSSTSIPASSRISRQMPVATSSSPSSLPPSPLYLP